MRYFFEKVVGPREVSVKNMVLVVGISPFYRGRNGSLLSIGQKGRFLRVKMLKRKQNG